MFRLQELQFFYQAKWSRSFLKSWIEDEIVQGTAGSNEEAV